MSLFGRGRKRRKGSDRLMGDDLSSHLKLLESYGEEQQTEKLREEVERLRAVCRALWSFIQEHHDLTEDDLKARVSEQKQKKGETCPQCGRVMSKTHGKCLYCGTEGAGKNVFEPG